MIIIDENVSGSKYVQLIRWLAGESNYISMVFRYYDKEQKKHLQEMRKQLRPFRLQSINRIRSWPGCLLSDDQMYREQACYTIDFYSPAEAIVDFLAEAGSFGAWNYPQLPEYLYFYHMDPPFARISGGSAMLLNEEREVRKRLTDWDISYYCRDFWDEEYKRVYEDYEAKFTNKWRLKQ